jgi:hypothetical protein
VFNPNTMIGFREASSTSERSFIKSQSKSPSNEVLSRVYSDSSVSAALNSPEIAYFLSLS